MDHFNYSTLSFSKVVELIGKPVEQDEVHSGPLEQDFDSKTSLLRVAVHQELLESASDFFLKPLQSDKWKEAKERRFELKASAGVLEFFGNWLYCRKVDRGIPWARWIDIHIFACEYLIDDLASDTIREMLTKLNHEQWIPNVEEIEHIYEHTHENSPLRELAITCLALNMSSERTEVLYTGPEVFIREFAVHVALHPISQLDEFKKRLSKPLGKHYISNHIWFKSTVSFPLENSSQPIVLHSDIFGKEGSAEPSYCSTFQAAGTRDIQEFGLRTFAAWLYFDDDLENKNHGCQECPDLQKLIDCYSAALLLSRCEIQVENITEVGEHEGDGLQERLHVQAYRFKESVIRAMVLHCQQRKGVPSLKEIERSYSITTAEDPLRKLLANVYISKGESKVCDASHVEFQGNLNLSLLNRLRTKEQYISSVCYILEQHKVDQEREETEGIQARRRARRYSANIGFSPPNAEARMEQLANVTAAWLPSMDAKIYL